MKTIISHLRTFSSSISFVIYGILVLIFLYFSWTKWGDPIIDTGRELYVPSELLNGRILYRDIAYHFGPLAPYLNALFYSIGGIHIGSLVASGLLSLILMIVALHQLSKTILDIFSTSIVVITFIAICAFGLYSSLGNYNFIIPYSYSATYCMAFALLGLYFYLKNTGIEDRNSMILSALFIFLALSTRYEIGGMALAAIVLPSLLKFAADKQRSVATLRPMLVVAGVSLGVAVITYGTFYMFSMNVNTGLWKIITAHISLQQKFIGWLAGTSNFNKNITFMVISCFWYSLLALMFIVSGLTTSLTRRSNTMLKTRIFLIVVPLTGVAAYLIFTLSLNYDMQLRCLPLLCLITAGYAVWNFARGHVSARQTRILTISLFSFLVLLRIVFHTGAFFYGFYLIVPGLIVFGFFFLSLLPSLFRDSIVGWFVKGGFIFLILLLILSHQKISTGNYAQRIFPIDSPRGTLCFLQNEEDINFKELLEYLKQNTNVHDTMAVFPEGVGINFFSERNNPLYDYSYDPLDLSAPGTSVRIIDQLNREKVAYIVLVQRDTTEFGYPNFGKDYATDIMEYINQNYDLLKQFGTYPFSSGHYSMALFKRRVSG